MKRADIKFQNGSTLVEMTMTLAAFVLLLAFLFNLALFSYKAVSLQFAVARTARWATLGETLTGDDGRSLDRLASIHYRIRQEARKFGINLDNGGYVYACLASAPDCSTDDRSAAEPNSYLVVRAISPVNMFFKQLVLNASASAIVKNEPYA